MTDEARARRDARRGQTGGIYAKRPERPDTPPLTEEEQRAGIAALYGDGGDPLERARDRRAAVDRLDNTSGIG